MTERRTEELLRVFDGEAERFEAIAPVVHRRFADMIGPQPGGPDLPTTRRQRHVELDNDHGIFTESNHRSVKGGVSTTSVLRDHQRQRNAGLREHRVDSVSLMPSNITIWDMVGLV